MKGTYKAFPPAWPYITKEQKIRDTGQANGGQRLTLSLILWDRPLTTRKRNSGLSNQRIKSESVQIPDTISLLRGVHKDKRKKNGDASQRNCARSIRARNLGTGEATYKFSLISFSGDAPAVFDCPLLMDRVATGAPRKEIKELINLCTSFSR